MLAPLRLCGLFLESCGFEKGAWRKTGKACAPAGAEAFGDQGLTPPLDPRKGHCPLTLFPAPRRVDFIPQI